MDSPLSEGFGTPPGCLSVSGMDNCGYCGASIPAGRDHCDECIRDEVRTRGVLTESDALRAREMAKT